MKTTVLFRMIVLVAMVFAGISNATVKAQNNNFITNEEKVDDGNFKDQQIKASKRAIRKGR